jgi:hypothetical protein
MTLWLIRAGSRGELEQKFFDESRALQIDSGLYFGKLIIN